MAQKIVIFGAGSTGRAHVGLLCWQGGLELVFVDRDPGLVAALRRAGRYHVRLMGAKPREVTVTGFRVYHSEERQAIADEIVDASLVLTAVFDANLPDVAQTLAIAAGRRRQVGRAEPLNCIACENMMDSSSVLGRYVRSHLTGREAEYCEEFFGFPDCMISRVVPRPADDPLRVVAEDYNEWTCRGRDFKGLKPAGLDALELVDNQTARLERKLFIHNGGHAICGYMGFHRGHTYIHEAVADSCVAEHVGGALDELGAVVRTRHGFSAESIEAYKQDLCRRGAVPEMKDLILRVVRDPLRKLSPRERLVAPAKLAGEYGLPRAWITRGIVAALRYQHPSDPVSCELSQKLSRKGLMPVLAEVCGLDGNDPLAAEILDAWRNWRL
jgi:mannitol-1-phosphate 5-dehydrogenase